MNICLQTWLVFFLLRDFFHASDQLQFFPLAKYYVVLLATAHAWQVNSIPIFHSFSFREDHQEKLANACTLTADGPRQFCMNEKAVKGESQGQLINLPERKPCCPLLLSRSGNHFSPLKHSREGGQLKGK